MDGGTAYDGEINPQTPKPFCMHNSSQTEPSPAPQGTSQGFAHAKAILFGEHAVVYGSPAVAVPLHGLGVQADIRRSPHQETRIESQLFSGTAQTAPEPMGPVVAGLKAALKAVDDPDAEVELLIRSAIPHSRGLGSSAAVATSVARAVANLHATVFDENTLHEIVQAAETVAHGRPSGIDAWAVAKPASIRFQTGCAQTIDVGQRLVFVLADSGHHGSTAEAVGGVRARRDADPTRIGGMIDRLAALTDAAVDDIRSGDRGAIGTLMNEAHGLLGSLGVSTPTLDSLVDAATAAGAWGAKLTGGGLGGCVLALADDDDSAEELAEALRKAGAPRTWTTEVRPT